MSLRAAAPPGSSRAGAGAKARPPPSSASAPHPAGWDVHRDPKTRRMYFHHRDTRDTTWALPPGVLQAGWRMAHHPTKGSYFFNRASGQSVWKPPLAHAGVEARSRRASRAAQAQPRRTPAGEGPPQQLSPSQRQYASLHEACRAGDAAAVQHMLDEHARRWLRRGTGGGGGGGEDRGENRCSDSHGTAATTQPAPRAAPAPAPAPAPAGAPPLPSRTELLESRNLKGDTPLFVAALYGHAGVLETLLRAGADANARSVRGLTALHKATMLGHTAAVRVLLRWGASVRARDQRGRTAADVAARFKKPQAASAIRRRSSIEKVRALVLARKFVAAAFHAGGGGDATDGDDSGGGGSDDDSDGGDGAIAPESVLAVSPESVLLHTGAAPSAARGGSGGGGGGGVEFFHRAVTLHRVRKRLVENLANRRARSAQYSSVRGSAVGRAGALATAKLGQGLHRSNWHSGDLEHVAEAAANAKVGGTSSSSAAGTPGAMQPPPQQQQQQHVGEAIHAVDLSSFTFGTEAAVAAAAESLRLRAQYKSNSHTESARWKALEPQQQAYVHQQMDKAVSRVLEVLDTSIGEQAVQNEIRNYGSARAARNAIVKRTLDATRDAAVDKFYQAAAKERERQARVRKKGTVPDAARAAGYASNSVVQTTFKRSDRKTGFLSPVHNFHPRHQHGGEFGVGGATASGGTAGPGLQRVIARRKSADYNVD